MPKETAITLPSEASVVIKIKTPEDLTRATSILSLLNKTLDVLTEQKEKLTKPLNATLKEIRARYKEPETILEGKISEIRQEMTTYQTKQMAIQAKKEAKLADKVAAGDITIEKAADALAKLPETPTAVDTTEGSVQFKPVKKFEVIDLSKLPIEYLVANEVKIRAAMNEGKELPGVRYYVEQVPYNSR